MRFLKSALIAFVLAISFVLFSFAVLFGSLNYVTQDADKKFVNYGKSILIDLQDIIQNTGKDRYLVLSVSMNNIKKRSLTEDSEFQIQKIFYLGKDLETLAHSDVISLADSFQESYTPEIYRIPDRELFYVRTIESYTFPYVYTTARKDLLADFQKIPAISWLGFIIRFFTPTEWNMEFMERYQTIHMSLALQHSEQSVFGERIHLFMTNTGFMNFVREYIGYYGTRILILGFIGIFLLTFIVASIYNNNGGSFSKSRISPPPYPPIVTTNFNDSLNYSPEKRKGLLRNRDQDWRYEPTEAHHFPPSPAATRPQPYTINYFTPPAPAYQPPVPPVYIQPPVANYPSWPPSPININQNLPKTVDKNTQPPPTMNHPNLVPQNYPDNPIFQSSSPKQQQRKQTEVPNLNESKHLSANFEAIPLERSEFDQ